MNDPASQFPLADRSDPVGGNLDFAKISPLGKHAVRLQHLAKVRRIDEDRAILLNDPPLIMKMAGQAEEDGVPLAIAAQRR